MIKSFRNPKNMNRIYPLTLFVFALLISCGQPQKQTSEEPQEETTMTESYSLDATATSVKWTAYKFTDKVGVSGTFDNVSGESPAAVGSIQEILQDATFSITTRSVNSQLQMRDDRIYNALFTTIGAETITGKFVEVGDGQGQVMITLGENSGEVAFDYTHAQDTVVITASMDLTSWNAEEGITALNEVCKDGHTGADGVSKLWPDVDIEVKVPVMKTQM